MKPERNLKPSQATSLAVYRILTGFNGSRMLPIAYLSLEKR
jgi:hypothetical protein